MKWSSRLTAWLTSIAYDVACLLLALLIWPPILLGTSTLLLLRQWAQLLYNFSFAGKCTLMAPRDAVMGVDIPPRLHHNNTVAIVLQRTFNDKYIENLRASMRSLLEHPNNWKLLCVPEVKLGFPCWLNVGETVKVEDHIKLCPGLEWGEVPISKQQLDDIVTSVASELFPKGRPKWELLIVPKVNYLPGRKSSDCGAVILHYCHSYMDGMSALSLCLQLFSEEPLEMQKSPPELWRDWGSRWVETLLRCPMFWVRNIIGYDRATLKFCGNQGASPCATCFSRKSPQKLTSRTVTSLRKSYGCSTESIFLSALVAALAQFGERKGLKVPHSLSLLSTRIILSYLNGEPQNATSLAHHVLPTEGHSLDRLNAVSSVLSEESNAKQRFTFLFSNLIGLLPVSVLRPVIRRGAKAYSGITMLGKIGGDEFKKFGLLDVVNHSPPGMMSLLLTIIPLDDSFSLAFAANQTTLVESAEDLGVLVSLFDLEIQNLIVQAGRMTANQDEIRSLF